MPVPVDLSKLPDVVKNDVAKKTEHNKLVTKVDNIDTTNFVKKNKYEKGGPNFEHKVNKVNQKILHVGGLVKKTDFNTKTTEIEGKIPNVGSFLSASVFNSKINEVGNKIPDIKNLVSKTELTAVENKISDVSSLVTKTDYAAEITNTKNDYVINTALNARHKDLVKKAFLT